MAWCGAMFNLMTIFETIVFKSFWLILCYTFRQTLQLSLLLLFLFLFLSLFVGGVWVNAGPLHYHLLSTIQYSYAQIIEVIKVRTLQYILMLDIVVDIVI